MVKKKLSLIFFSSVPPVDYIDKGLHLITEYIVGKFYTVILRDNEKKYYYIKNNIIVKDEFLLLDLSESTPSIIDIEIDESIYNTVLQELERLVNKEVPRGKLLSYLPFSNELTHKLYENDTPIRNIDIIIKVLSKSGVIKYKNDMKKITPEELYKMIK